MDTPNRMANKKDSAMNFASSKQLRKHLHNLGKKKPKVCTKHVINGKFGVGINMITNVYFVIVFQ